MTERKTTRDFAHFARPTLLAGVALAGLAVFVACGAPADDGGPEGDVDVEVTVAPATADAVAPAQPLVYVDGIRVDHGGASRQEVLAALDPASIERVEVLKGPAAVELYGAEASNGVIQIFLREEEDADGVRQALGSVLSGIGEGISRTGEGIKKAGDRLRKK